MGIGFTLSLSCIAFVRELIGAGTIFKGLIALPNNNQIIPTDFTISILVLAPGAFFVLALLSALQNYFKAPSATNTGMSSDIAVAETVRHALVKVRHTITMLLIRI